MSLVITLKAGGNIDKKETIRIENKQTSEVILVGLTQVKGKQARLRLVDNDEKYKISRIPDTYVETREGYSNND